MKTCLIGGAGFIGKALTRMLLEGHREVIVVDLDSPHDIDQRVNFISGNYGDKDFLAKALEGVDEIVLLAYSSVPKTSFEDPLSDITNNLPPTLTLLEAASALPLKKIVFLSSGGTVYGKTSTALIAEDAPTNPISPYGITKLAIEKYAAMYHALYGLPIVTLRPANAYGEGQRPYTGQGFIATAIASVIDGKELILFGQKGTTRDYVHVDDIARAIITVLDLGVDGECYNVGTGRGTDNREIIFSINKLAAKHGLKAKIKVMPKRHFDVPVNVLDASKLFKVTRWKPDVLLEEGLERTWKWFYEKQNETAANNAQSNGSSAGI